MSFRAKAASWKSNIRVSSLLGDFFLHTWLLERGKYTLQQFRRTIFQRGGRPKWRKKTYVIRFTNFLITAHIVIGGKDSRRRTLFCDIPFMKEQVSNQGKGTFYLNSKQGDLWPCALRLRPPCTLAYQRPYMVWKFPILNFCDDAWQQMRINKVTSFRSNWHLMALAKMKINFTLDFFC